MRFRVTRQGTDALACLIDSPEKAQTPANGPYVSGLGIWVSRHPLIRQKRHPHTRWRCLFLDAQPLEM